MRKSLTKSGKKRNLRNHKCSKDHVVFDVGSIWNSGNESRWNSMTNQKTPWHFANLSCSMTIFIFPFFQSLWEPCQLPIYFSSYPEGGVVWKITYWDWVEPYLDGESVGLGLAHLDPGVLSIVPSLHTVTRDGFSTVGFGHVPYDHDERLRVFCAAKVTGWWWPI